MERPCALATAQSEQNSREEEEKAFVLGGSPRAERTPQETRPLASRSDLRFRVGLDGSDSSWVEAIIITVIVICN